VGVPSERNDLLTRTRVWCSGDRTRVPQRQSSSESEDSQENLQEDSQNEEQDEEQDEELTPRHAEQRSLSASVGLPKVPSNPQSMDTQTTTTAERLLAVRTQAAAQSTGTPSTLSRNVRIPCMSWWAQLMMLCQEENVPQYVVGPLDNLQWLEATPVVLPFSPYATLGQGLEPKGSASNFSCRWFPGVVHKGDKKVLGAGLCFTITHNLNAVMLCLGILEDKTGKERRWRVLGVHSK
jgi:hypothetical protein